MHLFGTLIKTKQDQATTLCYPDNIGTGNHDKGDWRWPTHITGMLKANNLGFRSNQLVDGKTIVATLKSGNVLCHDAPSTNVERTRPSFLDSAHAFIGLC